MLAYGHVTQIKKKVSFVLNLLNPSPYRALIQNQDTLLWSVLKNFKHRFTSGKQVYNLLRGISFVIKKYDSIGDCFCDCWQRSGNDILHAISRFREAIGALGDDWTMFLADPAKGSSCKRWFLFLRWMVRRDSVDCGGWDFIKPSALIVPLDVHLHRASLRLKLTNRKSVNLRTAIEITNALRTFDPLDPVRYDFSLTRWSMDNFRKIF